MSSKASTKMSAAQVAAHLAANGKRIGTCKCGGPVMAQSSLVNLYTVCGACWKTTILQGR